METIKTPLGLVLARNPDKHFEYNLNLGGLRMSVSREALKGYISRFGESDLHADWQTRTHSVEFHNSLDTALNEIDRRFVSLYQAMTKVVTASVSEAHDA